MENYSFKLTTLIISFFVLITLVACSNQFQANSLMNFGNFSRSESLYRPKTKTASKDTVTYVRASTPQQIFQCTRKLALIRCLKLFLLQRLTGQRAYRNSGNITKDFLDQILREDKRFPSLLDPKYTRIDDKKLTDMLVESFQRFFKDRDIKLHFIPGVMVRVVPSNENKIKLSLRRSTSTSRKHKPYKSMFEMAIPVIMMPAVLVGTALPFFLPAIKMATIMTTVINNGALLAALMYAAKSISGNSEEHVIHYTHPGYH